MVWTVFSRVSARMRRFASATCGAMTSRVGPLASTRRRSVRTPVGPTVKMSSVLRPTAGSPRSWKPHAASVIPAKAGIQAAARAQAWIPAPRLRRSRASFAGMTNPLNNDVPHSARHPHPLLRLLAVRELHHVFVVHRRRLDLLATGVDAHVHVPAELAVHLQHELDGVL